MCGLITLGKDGIFCFFHRTAVNAGNVILLGQEKRRDRGIGIAAHSGKGASREFAEHHDIRLGYHHRSLRDITDDDDALLGLKALSRQKGATVKSSRGSVFSPLSLRLSAASRGISVRSPHHGSHHCLKIHRILTLVCSMMASTTWYFFFIA